MTAFVLDNLAILNTAPGGAPALRGLILELAMCGALTAREADELPDPMPSAPVPALGQANSLPFSWAWVRLDQIAQKITDGTHHSPPNGSRGDFRYISAKNIKPWGIDLTDVTFVTTDVHEQIFARCDPAPGDVLYIKDGATTGIVTINTLAEPFSMLSSVALIKPGNSVYNRFLLLAMQAPAFYRAMREGMTGVAITRVTLSKLKAAKLPLPPLAEQHRIVAKVDELMALCDRLEARQQDAEAAHARLVQALLDSLTQARDAEEFQACWERVASEFPTLFSTPSSIDGLRATILCIAAEGKFVQEGGGVQHLPISDLILGDTLNGCSRKPSETPVGLPILRISAGTGSDDFYVDEADHKWVEVTAAEREKFRLMPNDLLACRFNGNLHYVGSFALYRGVSGAEQIFPDKLIRFRVDVGRALPDYLRFVMNAMPARRQVESFCATTVGNIGISATNLKTVKVRVPCLAEQHRIVAKVTELFALCDQLKARIAAACAKHAQLAEALVEAAVA